jgi:lysozyme family protein
MKYKVRDATPEEFAEWRETDYWNKMDFDPLVMFVAIPTIVQVMCMGMMFAVMYLNYRVF